jgi:hypothetical protein
VSQSKLEWGSVQTDVNLIAVDERRFKDVLFVVLAAVLLAAIY